jgi:hypothetical protein
LSITIQKRLIDLYILFVIYFENEIIIPLSFQV